MLLLAGASMAWETDQFLIWGEEVSDASETVNVILNREIEFVLAETNRGSWRRLASGPMNGSQSTPEERRP